MVDEHGIIWKGERAVGIRVSMETKDQSCQQDCIQSSEQSLPTLRVRADELHVVLFFLVVGAARVVKNTLLNALWGS